MLNSRPSIQPLWQSAFRPLFLLGAFFSCLIMILWSLQLAGIINLNTYGSSIFWHAHEMLFGFTLAIVVGFLLTAVKNWTGKPSARGPALKMLVFLWCLSRLLWLFSDSPAWLVALIDAAFPLYSAYWLGKPLLKSGQKYNWPFVVVLIAMSALQIIYHLLMHFKPELISVLHQAVVLVMANLVFWIGGRVLPFFVQAKLAIPRRTIPNGLTPAAMICSWSLIPLLLLQQPPILNIVAIAAALLHGARLALYWRQAVITEPMLWSLFLAPCWILFGFIALAMDSTNWLHLITVGGLGGMILSIISRVSLGHNGERIRALRWLPIAFIFISLASLIRFFALDIQVWLMSGYSLSALLWLLAFSCFLVHYIPRLVSARKDELPG